MLRLAFASSSLSSNLFRQAEKGGAEAGGLGFVVVHDGILKQSVKSLDRLNLRVSLRHRHSTTPTLPTAAVLARKLALTVSDQPYQLLTPAYPSYSTTSYPTNGVGPYDVTMNVNHEIH